MGLSIFVSVADSCRQNRELQIMRIVRHPNIVELKAFYYSNGERVSNDELTHGLSALSLTA